MLPPESHVIWLYYDTYCGNPSIIHNPVEQTIAGAFGMDGCYKAEHGDMGSFKASDGDPSWGPDGVGDGVTVRTWGRRIKNVVIEGRLIYR